MVVAIIILIPTIIFSINAFASNHPSYSPNNSLIPKSNPIDYHTFVKTPLSK